MWPQFTSCLSCPSLLFILLHGKPPFPLIGQWCGIILYRPPSLMLTHASKFLELCLLDVTSCVALYQLLFSSTQLHGCMFSDALKLVILLPLLSTHREVILELCKMLKVGHTTSVFATLDMTRHSLESHIQSPCHDLNEDLRILWSQLTTLFLPYIAWDIGVPRLKFPEWAKHTHPQLSQKMLPSHPQLHIFLSTQISPSSIWSAPSSLHSGLCSDPPLQTGNVSGHPRLK